MPVDIYLKRFSHPIKAGEIEIIISDLFLKAGLNKVVSEHDLTAVKVHFGEQGNTTYLPALYMKPIVSMIKKQKAKPFVSDTNVLYKSRRDNAHDHLILAHEHGFTYETLGAPIIIADGISGRNEKEVETNAPMNKKISLAADFVSADSIIAITHVTGHIVTGLAATIKNLGMGMSSRKGKLRQHSVSKPKISPKACTHCGLCSKWCPENAITMVPQSAAVIQESKCIGCGECLAICRFDAVKFQWNSTNENLQKQIAEHALGIVKQKQGKIGYFTFLINMTPDCDCMKQDAKFVTKDIGVLAGTDPVAIDQAVLDLTADAKGNVATLSYPAIDPTVQLAYGEEIGLGSRKYKLTEI